MAAPDPFKVLESFKEFVGEGTILLDADTFKAILLASTSNIDATKEVYADLTGELATANGYTAGGFTLTGVLWTRVAGLVTFTSAAAVWTATGGSLTARFMAIYANVTRAGIVDPLVGFILLDSEPADVVTPDGREFAVSPPEDGWFDLSGGD